MTSGGSPSNPTADRPNPVLAALGYSPDTRLLVIHLDDVGMNSGTLSAWEAVLRAGGITSASVMMPCPDADDALDLAGRLQNQGLPVDMGVHLTLTCEWEKRLWGTRSPALAPLLTDSRGALPRNMREHLEITSNPESRAAVEKELRTQIEEALSGFSDLTHIDNHLFTLLYPPNLETYMNLALEYRLPCLLPGSPEAWRPWCGSDEEAEVLNAAVEPVRAAGMPLFDSIFGSPLEDPPADRAGAVRQLIRESVPGLNFLFLHANEATDEVKSFVWDWKERQGDMEVFSDPSLRNFAGTEGIILIGMKELRNLWRG